MGTAVVTAEKFYERMPQSGLRDVYRQIPVNYAARENNHGEEDEGKDASQGGGVCTDAEDYGPEPG